MRASIFLPSDDFFVQCVLCLLQLRGACKAIPDNQSDLQNEVRYGKFFCLSI